MVDQNSKPLWKRQSWNNNNNNKTNKTWSRGMTWGTVNTQYPSSFLSHRAWGRATFPVATPGGIFSSISPIIRQDNTGNHLRHTVRSDVKKKSHAYLWTHMRLRQVHVTENCKIKKNKITAKTIVMMTKRIIVIRIPCSLKKEEEKKRRK